MPKAEVGSTKYIANKMKSKGLQRLRWYCQICAKQCRDENGFKQHTLSEGHVRAMLLVGEDPRKAINTFSTQFQRDFLQLLRVAHGEKKVHMNNFYQEYIRDKEHVHMNATKWPSLTEFAKFLGREGIVRVEEGERGLEIAWVDDSVEAVRRREDVRRKDRLVKGDGDLEGRLLEEQIRRAREGIAVVEEDDGKMQDGEAEVVRSVGEPVRVSGFSLKAKVPGKATAVEKEKVEGEAEAIDTFSLADGALQEHKKAAEEDQSTAVADEEDEGQTKVAPAPTKISLSGLKKKPVNPLAKKNPLAKPKPVGVLQPEKKMSNAERIMKEEIERKRSAEERRDAIKRPRLA